MQPLKLLFIAVVISLLAQTTLAGSGRTTLLATSDPSEEGVIADLFLETKPGTGKIFIESSPLSRVDTQISTKFAKEVACNYIGRDCSELDFFYTIRARATIIGGPSAGAPMAALTVAVLEDVELNQSVAVTGTINSGNIIGPVGGVVEKIEAAGNAGIKKVLIPKGDQSSFAPNVSVDVVAHGRELGVEVVEVFSLDEALQELTGRSFSPPDQDIEIDSKYSEVMKDLADSLCERTQNLTSIVEKFRNSDAYNQSLDNVTEIAENLSNQGVDARSHGTHYAAASFCFGANVRYKYLELVSLDLNNSAVLAGLMVVEDEIAKLNASLQNATTVSDVQILGIVKDRLDEAREHLNKSRVALSSDEFENGLFEFAFATERVESARLWNGFFGVINELEIQEEMIKNACEFKTGEAIERVEYSNILLRRESETTIQDLQNLQKLFDEGNYVQCLYQATILKAEANTVLSVFGVKEEEVKDIVERKIDAAQATIARQTEKRIFPIVGYSYFEYADSLKDTNIFSALLFSEYALEFSNLDIYFKSNTKAMDEEEDQSSNAAGRTLDLTNRDLIGIMIGIVIISFILGRKSKGKKSRVIINRPKATKKARKKK